MPWTEKDVSDKTHLATTPALRSLWVSVANERLKATGDEALAIREANAVVHRQAQRRKASKGTSNA